MKSTHTRKPHSRPITYLTQIMSLIYLGTTKFENDANWPFSFQQRT